MEKEVYAIIFEEESENGEYSSGLSCILATKELARKTLNEIYLDELDMLKGNDYEIKELKINKEDDYFTIEYGCGIISFEILTHIVLEK